MFGTRGWKSLPGEGNKGTGVCWGKCEELSQLVRQRRMSREGRWWGGRCRSRGQRWVTWGDRLSQSKLVFDLIQKHEGLRRVHDPRNDKISCPCLFFLEKRSETFHHIFKKLRTHQSYCHWRLQGAGGICPLGVRGVMASGSVTPTVPGQASRSAN